MENEILVCHGFNCGTRYAEKIKANLMRKYSETDVDVDICGCLGNCHNSNNVMVNSEMLESQTPESVTKNVDRVLTKQIREKSGPMSTENAENLLGI